MNIVIYDTRVIGKVDNEIRSVIESMKKDFPDLHADECSVQYEYIDKLLSALNSLSDQKKVVHISEE